MLTVWFTSVWGSFNWISQARLASAITGWLCWAPRPALWFLNLCQAKERKTQIRKRLCQTTELCCVWHMIKMTKYVFCIVLFGSFGTIFAFIMWNTFGSLLFMGDYHWILLSCPICFGETQSFPLESAPHLPTMCRKVRRAAAVSFGMLLQKGGQKANQLERGIAFPWKKTSWISCAENTKFLKHGKQITTITTQFCDMVG